jgi:hypothetical protein
MEGSEDFPLRRELEVYESHRAELLSRAPGKYALIHGDELAGVFDTEADGINEGYRRFGYVPFLVHRIQAVDVPEYLPVRLAV